MEKNLLSLLNEKIDNLLNRYNQLQKEKEELESELESCKLKNEELQLENAELKETVVLKDLELEEIIGKIELVVGK